MDFYNSSDEVLIEKYRNFEIYFNTREETFHCISDYYDTEQKKKSYASCKTAIDTYIKENATFKPFFVIDCKNWKRKNKYDFPISNEIDVITITGIRKDRRFNSGDNQISEYDEKSYFLPLPENEPVFKELAPLLSKKEEYESKIDDLKRDIKKVSEKLKLISLKDFKKTLNS